uniref:Uncharacterized protein n=1 Tax=Panagrolaimus superbus TaxID=310955 RepID=A0A914YTK8_9BILA
MEGIALYGVKEGGKLNDLKQFLHGINENQWNLVLNGLVCKDRQTATYADFFRVGECKEMEENIKRLQHYFCRYGLLGADDEINNESLWCNRNMKQLRRNALFKIACTLAYSYRFTIDGKTLPSILKESMEIKSETELIAPAGYIGVYHKATRYSDGLIRAPMTFVSPYIFAHFTHPFQKMEEVNGKIELCTGYYNSIGIDVADKQRFFAFRQNVASKFLEHVSCQRGSTLKHAYDLHVSQVLLDELRKNQCRFPVFHGRVSNDEEDLLAEVFFKI